MHEEVVNRKAKRGKDKTVGVQTIRQYISAIKDLYTRQRAAGMNNHPDPRGAVVKSVIKTAMHSEHHRQRKNMEDPGKGTMLDGYTTVSELAELASYFFNQNSPVGHRDRLNLMLCHAGMLRSDEARNIEYSHIQCHEMQSLLEGETKCLAYQIVLRQGKSNQINNVQYASFLRAKNVEACPVSALGFYMFERFMTGRDVYPPSNTRFPDLSAGEHWYQIKLLKGSSIDLQKTMDYTIHRAACEAAYAACGWHFDKKTHAMRGSACRMADIGGASEANIKRAGRWEQGACEISYLKTMPKEAMRALAGFHPEGGDFFIDRAAVDPPPALKALIFPDIEEWEQYFSTCPPQERSLAATGFIRTLKELRTVILQDAVLLRKSHPNNYLWDHPIFNLPAFKEYEHKLEEVMKVQLQPVEMKLRQAMPALLAHLQATNASTMSAIKELGMDNATVERRLAQLSQDLSKGLQLWQAMLQPGCLQVVFKPQGGVEAALASEGAGPSVPEPVQAAPSNKYSPYPVPTGSPAPFAMSRKVASVIEAWREYDQGLGGRPSIRQMYEEGGAKDWKSNDSERKFYDRRMILVKFIKQQAELRKLTPEDIADIMDGHRVQLAAKQRSLAQIQERIKRGEADDLVKIVSPSLVHHQL